MKPNSTACFFHPNIFFLLLTLLITSAATAMLCVAILTPHLEYITWDKEKLSKIEKNITTDSPDVNMYRLEWLLNGQVARVVLESDYFLEKHSDNSKKTNSDKITGNNNLPALFLAPIQEGIWTHCIHLNKTLLIPIGMQFETAALIIKILKYKHNYIRCSPKSAPLLGLNQFLKSNSAEQHKLLEYMGFPKELCTNYLKLETITEGNLEVNWQHRMQNLSISCALVCLIVLTSSALIGTFGVAKQQNSAVLVAGVMYLLAAIFATFSLAILNFKRTRNKSDCLNTGTSYSYTTEGVILSATAVGKAYNVNKVNKYFEARIFSTGYSFQLGWGGIATCVFVSILWIFLSKIMRFNPINALLLID